MSEESAEAPADPGEVTRLLIAWRGGQKEAVDELFPLVYDDLRRIARRHLRSERQGHTLQPTALVNEAFLRLIDQNRVDWKSRAHFLALASQAMRRILVDHARKNFAAKRGGKDRPIPLELVAEVAASAPADVLGLDGALVRLARLDERQAKVVEYKFFGGMTLEEIAVALEISEATVSRDWRVARAWLEQELVPT